MIAIKKRPDYEDTLELFQLLSRLPPDTHRRALLRMATANDATWARFEPFRDME